MKTIILTTLSFLTLMTFTGCSSKPDFTANSPIEEYSRNNGLNSAGAGETSFTNLQDKTLTKNDTIIKVHHELNGKTAPGMSAISLMDSVTTEVEKRGYRYFQIISPLYISNLNGFPINNTQALGAFIGPMMTIPREAHPFNGKYSGMAQFLKQDLVDQPLLIFGTTEIDIVIAVIKEKDLSYDMVVWDVKDPRNN